MAINPYAAPQTPQSPPTSFRDDEQPGRGRKLRLVAFVLSILILIGAPIASGFAMDDIETIVVSGPILGIISLLTLGVTVRQGLLLIRVISLAMLAMVIGCFLTIFLREWSPSDAQQPIGWATVVFAVFIQLGWISLAKSWRRHEAIDGGYPLDLN